MIDDLLSDLALALGGGLVDAAVQRRREQKARAAGHVLGAVRVVGGHVPGIGESWQVAEFELSVRMLASDVDRVPVSSLAQRVERTKLLETPPTGADAVIFVLTTPTGIVEWAVPAADADGVPLRLGLPALRQSQPPT